MGSFKNIVLLIGLSLLAAFACKDIDEKRSVHETYTTDAQDAFAVQRNTMVNQQIAARGITDERVLRVLNKVPRHKFVPEELLEHAYRDYPLPIGEDQTISQPYIVALMTELLDLNGEETVLEIGTGSGYQAAVLAELTKEVYTIEIIQSLADKARAILDSLDYDNIYVISGDGYNGLPDKAPFDCIIVTAAPREIPQPLLDQLKSGGRMVIPVGEIEQDLLLIEKSPDGILTQAVIPVRFVPMTGKAMERETEEE